MVIIRYYMYYKQLGEVVWNFKISATRSYVKFKILKYQLILCPVWLSLKEDYCSLNV